MSAEIAPERLPGWQKPRLLPAANRIVAPNSAAIAAGDFSQINKIQSAV